MFLSWPKYGVNTYNIKTGNYFFEIKSSKKLFLSDYNNISQNENLPKVSIRIWIEESQILKNKFLQECRSKEKAIPKELILFYEEFNKLLNYKYEINNEFNEYYQSGNEVYLCFQYITDEFYIYYKKTENEIFVIGNENNLERIIIDFLTFSSIILPLHAIGMQSPNGLGIGILGESGSGKTSFMIKLLERGFYFLTDDALFIDKNKNLIRVNTSFSYRKKYPNNLNLEKYSKTIDKEKIIINFNLAKHLMNFNYTDKIEKYKFFKLNNIKKIEELKEPFPCISKNSFWCMQFIVKQDKRRFINNLLKKSIYEWNKILSTSEFIKIDFRNLEQFTDKFIDNYNKR